MEESVGTADMSDNGATQVNAELLPEAPVNSTAQDAETLLPSLCEAATLESSPEVAFESGADGFPSDQTAVEPSNNATAVTEASSSVASFEHTATPQSETSTTENEADETLPPEKIDENPVEIVANDMPLPDNLTVTYSLPPDASGKNTENVDLVVTTPAVSDASAGVSAINDGEDMEPCDMQTKPLNHLQKLLCKVKRVIFHAWLQTDFRMEDLVDGKLNWKISSAQQGQENFRKENGLGGVANSFIVFADTFRGDPPAAEAALKLVADPQLTTENRKVYPPFVYM